MTEKKKFDFYSLIKAERVKQDGKWKEQNHEDSKWLAILVEEVGEVAKMVNELYPAFGDVSMVKTYHLHEDLKEELVQTAAVCVAWLEYLERKQLILL